MIALPENLYVVIDRIGRKRIAPGTLVSLDGDTFTIQNGEWTLGDNCETGGKLIGLRAGKKFKLSKEQLWALSPVEYPDGH